MFSSEQRRQEVSAQDSAAGLAAWRLIPVGTVPSDCTLFASETGQVSNIFFLLKTMPPTLPSKLLDCIKRRNFKLSLDLMEQQKDWGEQLGCFTVNPVILEDGVQQSQSLTSVLCLALVLLLFLYSLCHSPHSSRYFQSNTSHHLQIQVSDITPLFFPGQERGQITTSGDHKGVLRHLQLVTMQMFTGVTLSPGDPGEREGSGRYPRALGT